MENINNIMYTNNYKSSSSLNDSSLKSSISFSSIETSLIAAEEFK